VRFLVSIAIIGFLLAQTASSAEAAPIDCKRMPEATVCTNASNGGFNFGGLSGSPTKHVAPGALPPVNPISSKGPAILRTLAPACSGNTPTDAGLTCGAATTTCPKPGDIAFWTWTATLDPKTGKQTPWVLQTNPPTTCMGPTAPGVPKAVVIRTTIEREFKRLVVLKGVATPQPAGKTLVNFDTVFYTGAAAYQLPPITIVGSTVRLRASPAQYDWYFGDGARLVDGGPGAKDTEQVTHRYTGTGRVGPYVVVTWSGTFTVDGDPAVQQVNGQAVTTGNPAALQVETAPSELVAH
jgi:hypothetical protein